MRLFAFPALTSGPRAKLPALTVREKQMPGKSSFRVISMEGKALVILEPDIERGLVAVHQVAFQEQGVGFIIGDDEIQGGRPLQQVLDQRVVFFLKILGDPFF